MTPHGLFNFRKQFTAAIDPGPRELGEGGTRHIENSVPILGTTYGFDSSTNLFREVIVAKKYQGVVPPLPVAALGGTSTNDSLPSTPRDAESSAKSFLGISSNYQLDRWWVKSTYTSSVSTYSTPSTGYSFHSLISATHNGDVIALLEYHEVTISSSRKDYWILSAIDNAFSGPAVETDGTTFAVVQNPDDIETAATTEFGEDGFARWEIKEETTKLSPTQNFPTSWFSA